MIDLWDTFAPVLADDLYLVLATADAARKSLGVASVHRHARRASPLLVCLVTPPSRSEILCRLMANAPGDPEALQEPVCGLAPSRVECACGTAQGRPEGRKPDR